MTGCFGGSSSGFSSYGKYKAGDVLYVSLIDSSGKFGNAAASSNTIDIEKDSFTVDSGNNAYVVSNPAYAEVNVDMKELDIIYWNNSSYEGGKFYATSGDPSGSDMFLCVAGDNICVFDMYRQSTKIDPMNIHIIYEIVKTE